MIQLTRNMILNMYIKRFVEPLVFIFLLIVITVFYVILHLYPFDSGSIVGFGLDILFIFVILAGSNTLIYYLHKKKKEIHILSIFLLIISVITVVMVYFYKYEKVWKLNEQLTFIEVIIGITSAIVVIWGGYLALKQMREAVNTNKIATQSNKLSSFSNMIDILQEEKVRNDRKIVFSLFDDERNYIRPWKSWSEEEKKAAQDTLVKIDQIGLMVKYGLLDYEFIEGWTYSIYKCIYILKDYKDSEEFRYYYKIKGTDKKRSNYYLGINELINRRNTNIVYDYEEKQCRLNCVKCILR